MREVSSASPARREGVGTNSSTATSTILLQGQVITSVIKKTITTKTNGVTFQDTSTSQSNKSVHETAKTRRYETREPCPETSRYEAHTLAGRKLTWKTVTVAQRILLKCFRSQTHFGCRSMISEHLHSREPSASMQNLPPNRYIPRMLGDRKQSSRS